MIKDSECTKDTPLFLGYLSRPIYGTGVSIRPGVQGKQKSAYDQRIFLPELLPLEDYDLLIVLFSGGKDSMAAYYRLLEMGVPKTKIELWHHDIDGGNPEQRMDWPVTQAYVRSFAQAEGVRLRVSYRVNGFFGEVFRIGAAYPIEYEDGGVIKTCRPTKAQTESDHLRLELLQELCSEESDLRNQLAGYGCRMKFPMKTGDLSRRWCSAALKIDVSTAVIRNLDSLKELGCVRKLPAKSGISNGRYCSPQLKREVDDSVLRNLDALKKRGHRGKLPAKSGCHQGRWCSGNLKAAVQNCVTSNLETTMRDAKILVVSGERRGESAGRSRYNEMEVHRTNATAKAHRLVHTWRAVIDYTLTDVWEVIRRHRATPHPCYSCGWNRCSCMMCIFSLPRHWAGIRELFPQDYEAFCQTERELGFTLDNKLTLDEYVGDAESCVVYDDPKAIRQLLSGEFSPQDVYTTDWTYPAGAFRGGSEGGPC